MGTPVAMTDVQDLYRSLSEKLSGEELEAAFSEVIEGIFDQATANVANYVIAPDFKGERNVPAPFDVMSLGNWITIASEAGVPFVPIRFLAAPRSLSLFSDAMGNPRNDNNRAELEALDEAIQSLRPDEMLRFDHCGSSALKSRISKGQPVLAGDARGVVVGHNGQIDHIICERLGESFINSMSEAMPVWARPIIKPKTRPGWDFHTGQSGDWPAEWRVYVREGKVVGISNYYPQSAAGPDEIGTAKRVAVYTDMLIQRMGELQLYPHHPRYVAAFEPETISFSADYIVAEDGECLFLEGGPAHIYKPAFGASPCCFNPHDGITGIALAQGNVVSMEAVAK